MAIFSYGCIPKDVILRCSKTELKCKMFAEKKKTISHLLSACFLKHFLKSLALTEKKLFWKKMVTITAD